MKKKKDDKKMGLVKPVSLYIMCIYILRPGSLPRSRF